MQRWQAPATPAVPIDEESFWGWLQAHGGKPAPALYLGYGVDDRFATSDVLLGAVLPPAHVFTVPGGHDWPVWETLWKAILPTLPLPRDPSCAG